MTRGGWDGPVRVFALVRSQVLAADPELAGHLPSDVSLQAAQHPESLFSVEQEGLPPAASVGDLLAQLAWPETVDGAAVSARYAELMRQRAQRGARASQFTC